MKTLKFISERALPLLFWIMLMLAFEIEDKFSVELRTGVKFTTVGDVVEYIEKAKK